MLSLRLKAATKSAKTLVAAFIALNFAVACGISMQQEAPKETIAAATVQVEDVFQTGSLAPVVVSEYALENLSDTVNGREVNAYWFPARVDDKAMLVSVHAITDEKGHWGDLPKLSSATSIVKLTSIEMDTLAVGAAAESEATPEAQVHASLKPGGAICGNRAFAFRATLDNGSAKYRVYVGFHLDAEAGMGSALVAPPMGYPVPGVATTTKDLCSTYAIEDCTPSACQLNQYCTTQFAYKGSVKCNKWVIDIGANGKCWKLGIGAGSESCTVDIPAKGQDTSLAGKCGGSKACQCHLTENCPPTGNASLDIADLLAANCSKTCVQPVMPPGMPPCGGGAVAVDAGVAP
jgi:hypothetical protein